MTVEYLLSHISSRELSEWMAYYKASPFGEERSDIQAAIVAATIANCNRDGKKKPNPYKVNDFLPKFGPPRQQSPEEMKRILRSIYGGSR